MRKSGDLGKDVDCPCRKRRHAPSSRAATPSCGDNRHSIPGKNMTAGFGPITRVVMVFQRSLRSCFFCLRRSHKDLPQACRVKRPLLHGKVIKVRIDAAADKFQFRHLPGSPAI